MTKARRSPFSLIALGLLLALGLGACSHTAEAKTPPPIVIMVSLDAFRADYLQRPEAKNLKRLAAEGLRMEYLQSVYPADTFPNHYAQATGLRPAHHGIVANRFFDPDLGRHFSSARTEISSQPHWWKGEPIWNTAKRQGVISASVFWVGSDIAINGELPSFWIPYKHSLPQEKRIEEVLKLLAKPELERPRLIMLYMEEVDDKGHAFGPDSPELNAAIAHLDAMVGKLDEGVRQLGLQDRVNLLIMSDHGMSEPKPGQEICLDDYLDPSKAQVTLSASWAAIRPNEGVSVAELLARFPKNLPGAHVCESSALPPEFHYNGNPRIAPLWIVAEPGWRLLHNKTSRREPKAGHGYDPRTEEMHALFIAKGPLIRRHGVIPSFENIQIYNLVCSLLAIQPAPNDGDDRLVRAVQTSD